MMAGILRTFGVVGLLFFGAGAGACLANLINELLHPPAFSNTVWFWGFFLGLSATAFWLIGMTMRRKVPPTIPVYRMRETPEND